MTTPSSLARTLDRLRVKWQTQGIVPARQIAEPLAPKPRPTEVPLDMPRHSVHLYPGDHLHGRTQVSSIATCDASPLGIAAPPAEWAFLDTETTGLAGGTGTYAFLIGVGIWEDGAFRIHQFFMRDFCEESNVLDALADLLAPYEVLVTYNGKSYDGPLLETRYRMSRRAVPHEDMQHLDLLHAARRIWKLRLQSCRLVELEAAVLGHERIGDVPGHCIPYRYFEYLQTGRTEGLEPVLHHNRMDVLSLACLTSVVLGVLGDPSCDLLADSQDLYSLAGWLARMGRSDKAQRDVALDLYARALGGDLPAEISARARWEMAAIHKRNRDYARAIPLWQELDTPEASLELAKYYEHRARDYPAALDLARGAGDQRRVTRLQRKAARRGALAANAVCGVISLR